ncbi:MAG TPA: hypothetical protein VFE90_09130 [Myxococcales bacterium]|jgi:hypothetical protein|nr:hypothetical protein [Myxococcales bacterium]
MITPQAIEELRHAGPDGVRRYVHETLLASESFDKLPRHEQDALANRMVKVLSYLCDPLAGHPQLAEAAKRGTDSGEVPLAAALADDPRKKQPPPFGPAAQAAPDVFKRFVDTVDFPKFVSGLIEGVYTSIVRSSIQQMEAYSKLMEAVVKSTPEFARDHVTPDQARGFLRDKFPSALKIEDGKLAMQDNVDDKDKPDFKNFLGLTQDLAVDDEEQEQKLMESAQLKMAKQRQQQIASMVMMGINRIVVTEGEIKASVLFDVTAESKVHTEAESSRDDTQTHFDAAHSEDSSFWGTSGSSSDTINTRVTTAHARTAGQSDDKLKAHANLSGSVLVRFKSETFPLERMASPDEMAAAQERSKK